jgi:predicted MPP superfamily phosphohydrolase
LRVPLAAVAIGLGCLGYGALERGAFRLRRTEVAVLKPGSAALRLLHISDLHLTPRRKRERNWVRGLAALEPDLVVNTGDNLAHQDSVSAVLDALDPLLNHPGAFVFGSNDYYEASFKNPLRYLVPQDGTRRVRGRRLPYDELRQGMTSRGWVDLNNARARIKIDHRELELVGTDDAHIRRDRYNQVGGGADPGAALRLGVTHAPYRRVLDAMAVDGFDLILAGHTHGGQLCVPGFGALVTNCDLPRRQASGLSQHHVAGAGAARSLLHVSAGVGTSPFAPVRFACRPEATLLTLVATEA